MRAQWQDPPEYRDPGPGSGVQMAMPPLTPAVKLLLWITGGVFLVTFLLFVLPGTDSVANGIVHWFAISPDTWIELAPFLPLWQLVTWGFLHSLTSPTHILYNMLLLYFLGTMLEESTGARRFLTFYVSALLVSGIVTLAVALAAGPTVLGQLGEPSYPQTLGASGAVLAIVVAAATLHPKRRILFLLFPITLKTLAIFLVGLDVFWQLLEMSGKSSSNVARLAHLSGAAWGFWLVKSGWIWRDVGATVEAWRVRKREAREVSDEERLDELLQKINHEGIGALSHGERAFLKRASKRRSGG